MKGYYRNHVVRLSDPSVRACLSRPFFSESLNSFVFELLCTCFVVLKANFNVILSEKCFYVCTHCTLRGIAVPAQPTNALCRTIEVLLPIRVTGNRRLVGTVPVQTVAGRS